MYKLRVLLLTLFPTPLFSKLKPVLLKFYATVFCLFVCFLVDTCFNFNYISLHARI